MAHTARKKDEKKEFFDPPDVLEKKVEQLAQWIRESKHMIAFTGAGISTAAGIPDFRSGMDTKLSTGPGVWELKAKGVATRDTKHKVTAAVKALPTPTHMMIVKLQQEGILKCCISQNTDGLHRRSGLPREALAELHGNTNLEVCRKCGREYLRDFRVRNAKRVKDHRTGRKCDNPSCQGILRDTIINFGEDLPDSELTRGTEESEVADLCLAMGSSLTVTPAADIPECVAERGEKLVIVNLQKTPLHSMAALCIHAKCEEVSAMLMGKLGLPIPEFRLKRRVFIKVTQSTNLGPPEKQVSLSVEGQDMYGFYFSFLTGVTVSVGERPHQLQEPFSIRFPWRASAGASSDEMKVQLTFHFQGHYGEPPLDKELIIKKGDKEIQLKLLLIYDPGTSEWSIEDDATAAVVAPTAGIKKLTLKES